MRLIRANMAANTLLSFGGNVLGLGFVPFLFSRFCVFFVSLRAVVSLKCDLHGCIVTVCAFTCRNGVSLPIP